MKIPQYVASDMQSVQHAFATLRGAMAAALNDTLAYHKLMWGDRAPDTDPQGFNGNDEWDRRLDEAVFTKFAELVPAIGEQVFADLAQGVSLHQSGQPEAVADALALVLVPEAGADPDDPAATHAETQSAAAQAEKPVDPWADLIGTTAPAATSETRPKTTAKTPRRRTERARGTTAGPVGAAPAEIGGKTAAYLVASEAFQLYGAAFNRDQAEVATSVGISVASLHNYMRGKSKPKTFTRAAAKIMAADCEVRAGQLRQAAEKFAALADNAAMDP